MQEQSYSELERRASSAAQMDAVLQLEAGARVRRVIDDMRTEGKALTLSGEEIKLLESFRRFKLRMRKDGEVFTWQTRRPEGVQIVEETAEILHPSELAT